MAFPPLLFDDESTQISKPTLREEDVVAQAIETVRSRHERIANTLTTIWGYQECADYLDKLAFYGSDPAAVTKTKFDPDVARAILLLSRIHKANKS